MARKDYVGRERSTETHRKKNTNKSGKKKRSSGSRASASMIVFAAIVIVTFISGLWFITHHKKEKGHTVAPVNRTLNNGLPPKPEERWRYIKELENRQVIVPAPTEPNAGGNVRSKTQLTDEQRQLLEQIQADMKQPPTPLNEIPQNGQSSRQILRQQNQLQMQSRLPPPHLPANTKHPAATESTMQRPQTELTSKEQEKKSHHWLIQCGSFKATSQAESMRARLAIEGVESRITTRGDWNRVILGPFNHRSTVDDMLKRLQNSVHINCIPVAGGIETH